MLVFHSRRHAVLGLHEEFPKVLNVGLGVSLLHLSSDVARQSAYHGARRGARAYGSKCQHAEGWTLQLASAGTSQEPSERNRNPSRSPTRKRSSLQFNHLNRNIELTVCCTENLSQNGYGDQCFDHGAALLSRQRVLVRFSEESFIQRVGRTPGTRQAEPKDY